MMLPAVFLAWRLMATALYAMAVNFNVTSLSGLRHLDDYLLTRYYISGYVSTVLISPYTRAARLKQGKFYKHRLGCLPTRSTFHRLYCVESVNVVHRCCMDLTSKINFLLARKGDWRGTLDRACPWDSEVWLFRFGTRCFFIIHSVRRAVPGSIAAE